MKDLRSKLSRGLRSAASLVLESISQWRKDRAQRMAAALAFYTTFSLAPLLVIGMAIAGFFVRRETVQARILDQVREFVGTKGAEAVTEMMVGITRPRSNLFATLLSIALLLFGASRVFSQLQSALDSIWKVPPRPGLDILTWIRSRLVSVSFVLGTGFLLLVSLLASAALSTILTLFESWVPGLDQLWPGINFIAGLTATALFFAAIFKILPRTKIPWRDVWIGALGATLLFTVGRHLLGLYLSWGIFHSVYGALGSIVAILLWVYYSSQILLFGAEFTHVYARRYGSKSGKASPTWLEEPRRDASPGDDQAPKEVPPSG